MLGMFRYYKGYCILLLVFCISIIPIVSSNVGASEETSIKIAFDETHDPMWKCEGFLSNDLFRSALEESYDVTVLNDTLNEEILSEYDILIIAASQTSYTTNEINFIENWTRSGGSILLISDYQEWSGAAVMSIAQRFGFEQRFEALYDNDDFIGLESWIIFTEGNIQHHNVTTGVDRIEIYASGGIIKAPDEAIHLVITDNDNSAYWDGNWRKKANSIPVVSILENNSCMNGKLAITTDGNFLSDDDQDEDGTDDFYDSNNEIMILNMIKWLADKEYGQYSTCETLNYKLLVIVIIPFFVIYFLKKSCIK
jgi:hypothetical protein